MSKAINNVRSDIYIGTGAGKMILEDIESARKSIQIMSPYLSARYVDILLERHYSGVHIELITSDELEDHKQIADRYTYKIIRQHIHIDQQKKNRKNILLWVGVGLVIFSGLLLGLKFLDLVSPNSTEDDLIQALVLIGVLLVGIFLWKQSKDMRFHFYSYSSLFPIKIFYSYFSKRKENKQQAFTLHSKVYIIDDRVAYLGSVNYTRSGLSHNHETRIRITDPEAIAQLKLEFAELLNDYIYSTRTLDEWGKKLYEN